MSDWYMAPENHAEDYEEAQELLASRGGRSGRLKSLPDGKKKVLTNR